MAIRKFDQYYDADCTTEVWKTEVVKCDDCGWEDKLEKSIVEETRYGLIECVCPKCMMATLAEIPIPAPWEVRMHHRQAAKERPLTEAEKMELYQLDKNDRENVIFMHSANQFPDIDNEVEDIFLTWDCKKVGRDPYAEHWTIIRHGSAVICTEPAVFNGIVRFEGMVGMLKKRYGKRLVNVAPTHVASLWLVGATGQYEETMKRVSKLFEDAVPNR